MAEETEIKKEPEQPKEHQKSKSNENDNTVFIGDKPFINYITSIAMQFNVKKSKEVIVKARGRYISRAVDVVEAVRKRFLKDHKIEIKAIRIDSEKFKNKKDREVNVSGIEITLIKN